MDTYTAYGLTESQIAKAKHIADIAASGTVTADEVHEQIVDLLGDVASNARDEAFVHGIHEGQESGFYAAQALNRL